MDANDNNNSNLSEIKNVKRELLEDTASETSNTSGMIQLIHPVEIASSDFPMEGLGGIKRRSSEEPKMQATICDGGDDSTDIAAKRQRFDSECNEPVINSNDNTNNQSEIQAENLKYTLIVSTLSGKWTSEQIIDFLVAECNMNYSCINDNRNTDSETNIQIKLKFSEKGQLEGVFNKLKKLESEAKLRVESDDMNEDGTETNVMQVENMEPNRDENPPSPDLDAAADENAFYLREDFLESLGIEPPITNWVTVTNFRCHKTELKEVLELAGKVLVCSVIAINKKYAKVMYSHPLEAIQAISMLNGQKLYGQSLKLTMNNSRDIHMLLPKGLADVGAGLGKYGKSLPDVTYQFKRFIDGQKSTIDAQLFQPEILGKFGIPVEHRTFTRSSSTSTPSNHNEDALEHSDVPSEGNPERNVSFTSRHFVTTPANPPQPVYQNNPINYIMSSQPVVQGTNGPTVVPRAPLSNPVIEVSRQMLPPSPVSYPRPSVNIDRPHYQASSAPGPYVPQIRPQSNSPVGLIRGPVGQIRGPVGIGSPNRFPSPNLGPTMSHGPRGHNPNIQGTLSHNGPAVPPLRLYSRLQSMSLANVQMFQGTQDPVIIYMSNLPPTTTFGNLCQKLSEFGRVLSLELTTPGCAVARFADASDADNCIQNFRQAQG